MTTPGQNRKDSKSKSELTSNKEEKFQEDRYLKSYNQEFKETVNSFKGFHPILQEQKLFHHFETNNNTSISSTTGQMEVSLILS